VVALKVLGLNVVALGAAVFFPVFGLAIGWIVGAYAIGRGLFVAVAMRRMPQSAAELLYLEHRPVVLAQGMILTFGSYIPLANLFVTVLSVATMVHLLDIILISVECAQPGPPRPLIGG
jgi:CysZ protein